MEENQTMEQRIAEFEKYNPIAKSIVDAIRTIDKMNQMSFDHDKEQLLLKYLAVKKILDFNF